MPSEPRQGCHAKRSARPTDKIRHRRPAGQTCGCGGWKNTSQGRCGQSPPSTSRLWKTRLHLRHLTMLRVRPGVRPGHAYLHATLQAMMPGLLAAEKPQGPKVCAHRMAVAAGARMFIPACLCEVAAWIKNTGPHDSDLPPVCCRKAERQLPCQACCRQAPAAPSQGQEGPPGACCSLAMQASMASRLSSRRRPTLISPPATSSTPQPRAACLPRLG